MALNEELKSQGDFLFKYRGTLPIFILAIALSVFTLHVLSSPEQLHNTTYWYVCLGICLLGQSIRIYTVGYTPAKTSGRNTGGQLAETLNTTGIYSTVRHPLYLGNFIMWLAVAMLTQELWFVIAFIFIYWVYYERIMFAEESFLRSKFGKPYEIWAANRPAFWPKFSQYKHADLQFSWKKVVKKEKNGLTAIFLLFWLFNYLKDVLFTGTIQPIPDFWFLAMVVSILYYLLVKLLDKKTNLLKDEGR